MNLQSVLTIVKNLQFVNEDLVPISEASVVCLNKSTLDVYCEYADNFGLNKSALLNSISQELELSYSTFGNSQTKVLIFFYGSAVKADECADLIKDSIEACALSPSNSPTFTVTESPAQSSLDSTQTRTSDSRNEEANDCVITSSQGSFEEPSSNQKDLDSERSVIKKILAEVASLKKSNLEAKKSFKILQNDLKKMSQQVKGIENKLKKDSTGCSATTSISEQEPRATTSSEQEPRATTSSEQEPRAITSDFPQSEMTLQFGKFTTAKAAEDYFENKIVELRASVPWIKAIRTLRMEEIPLETMRKIRSIFVVGPQKYGRFLNRILTRLFGIIKMKTTLMVKHSARHRLKPGKDRQRVFSTTEEKVLKDLLLKIDRDLFSEKQVWEKLVRQKANQFGRDLNKRNIEEEEEDQDLNSSEQDSDED